MKIKRCILRLTALTLALLCLLIPLSSCHPSSGGAEEEELPEIVVGSDEYEPYFYADERDDFTGFDVELATEAFRRLGYRAKFVKIKWTRKNELLDNGTVDCLWGVLHNDRTGGRIHLGRSLSQQPTGCRSARRE